VKVKLVTIREQKSCKSLRGVIVLDSFDKVTFSSHQLVVPWWFIFCSLVIPWLFLGYYLSFLPYSFRYLIFHQSLAVGNYYYFQVLRILDG